ncbi:hypothetical protein KCH_49750 [Kitasatospora cheerisanensis KCTC 2395]|uniref:Uncharacterized protein n=1 Tax=Kitasatospora cheerisanensis KCTC 2395 TaxID=1348663 RepID=A0A066YPL5_9ACTN|nr:hypothetical protein KCH_49750 [Kitasatospora cheerisanensis KCTC 2395]
MSTITHAADGEDAHAFGYCPSCRGYGLGTYDGPINSHSDRIRDHVNCPSRRQATGARRRSPRSRR